MVLQDWELLFGGGLILRRSPMESVPGMIIDNFSEEVQEEYKHYHMERYPAPGPQVEEPKEVKYKIRKGVNGTAPHHKTHTFLMQ